MISTLIDRYNIEYFEGVLMQWRDVDDPDMIFIGVMDDDFSAVGALVVREYGGRFYIKHIGVDEAHVRSGYGSFLLSECVRIAGKTGEVSVSAELPVHDEMTEGEKAVVAFFEKNGFGVEDTGGRRKIYAVSDLMDLDFGGHGAVSGDQTSGGDHSGKLPNECSAARGESLHCKSYQELTEEEKEQVAELSWTPEFMGDYENGSRFVFQSQVLKGAVFFRMSYDRISLEMIVGAKLPVLSSIFEEVKQDVRGRMERGEISEQAELVIDYIEERLEESMEKKYGLKAVDRYRMMVAAVKV